MNLLTRAATLALAGIGLAHARPVTLESRATFGTPDVAYTGFGVAVAISGDQAIVTASRNEPVPDGDFPRNFRTAFLLELVGTRWTLVRRLEEHLEDPNFRIPEAVAMRGPLAAVQTVQTDFYELGAGGWTRSPQAIETDGPGRFLAIDGARVLSGDGTCSMDGRVFEKDTAGTWRTTALLPGAERESGCDNDFRGGPADLDGDWAAVHQATPLDAPAPFTTIYRFEAGFGWFGYSDAVRPANATAFGAAIALRAGDLLVAGSNESGTYVYRDTDGFGFQLAGSIQTVDGFMGNGRATGFAKSAELVLQNGRSFDRGVGVVNVFRRLADGRHEHVAILAARNGESLGNAIAISGHRVLVGNNGNGRVHYFELPENLAPAPAARQDAFATGNGTGWTVTAGSSFATVQSGPSRVFRQSSTAVEARAVLAAVDWTSVAIEADVRPRDLSVSGAGFGLVTRWQSPQNFYDVVLRAGGTVELRRMASGTLRTLARAAFAPVANRTYRLRLESVGTLHRVLIDGVPLIDLDSTGPTHGRAGLLTDHAAVDFDNVVVSPSLNATIYASDFESGAAGPWTHTGLGFWMLWPGASTTYFQSSVAGDARAAIGAPAGDQIVRVRARLDTFGSPGTLDRWFGVMARYVDERNYYYLSLRSSNTVSLHKRTDGAVTTLATAPLTVSPGVWYRLRLDALGTQLRAYVNDVPVLEAVDATHALGAAGPVMFRAAVDYDDFQARQP